MNTDPRNWTEFQTEHEAHQQVRSKEQNEYITPSITTNSRFVSKNG